MQRRNFRGSRALVALAAALAFAFAWFAPRAASAKILPACELAEQATLVPAPEPNASDASQDSDGSDADCVDSTFAPMCDERGASVAAPPRIHHVSDATIDAPGACAALEGPAATLTSHGPDVLAGSALALDPATAPDLPEIAGRQLLVILTFVPPVGGPLPGITRGVDRPPR